MSRDSHSPILIMALLMASSLTIMAGATLAPALPDLNEHFRHVPQAALLSKLVLTLPAFFIAGLAPFMGAIADRFGRKPLLLASAALYGLAGASGYFIDWLPGILIGRAFFGIAMAGLMTSSMALVGDTFDGEARNRFMGLQASFVGLGGVGFLALGGFLASMSWRTPFLIYLVAILLIPLFALALHEPERQTFDRSGANEGKAPVGTVAFIYGTMLMTMTVLYLVPVQVPFLLKSLIGATPTQSGLAIAAGTLTSALIAPLFPRIRARLGDMNLLGTSLGIAGVGLAIVGTAQSYGQVVIGLAVQGAGLGMNMPNMSAWLMRVAPPHLRGRLAGGLTTSLFLGQFLSPLISEPLGRKIGLHATFGWVGVSLGIMALGLLSVQLIVKRKAALNVLPEGR
ncbi:Tetracycline resistance protein, class C [compost metagenome]